jgi:hypothetical protein
MHYFPGAVGKKFLRIGKKSLGRTKRKGQKIPQKGGHAASRV